MTHYLKSIEDWVGRDASYKQPVARTAWAILQDFHHDSAVVEYPPEAVAVAAIQLSMQIYGATVPLCSAEGKNSWQVVCKNLFSCELTRLLYPIFVKINVNACILNTMYCR